MAAKMPDFSTRPVVIRGNFLKGGLFLLAFAIVAGWFGIWTWNSDDFDWISVIAAGILLPLGLLGIIGGPVVLRIGDDTVRLAEKRTWWSVSRISEWPFSEFENVSVHSTGWEDGSTSYDVILLHASGRRINLAPGKTISDEDQARRLADGVAGVLNVPVEWSDP